MVRLEEDVDGCGCIRCQGVDHAVVRRSLSGALVWSVKLPILRPSILFVFLAIGFLQMLAQFLPAPFTFGVIGVGVLGVFAGRGYLGILGRDLLGTRQSSPVEAIKRVVFRLPAFVGAVLVILAILATLGLVAVVFFSSVVGNLFGSIGVGTFTADVLVLLLVTGGVFYVLVKCCFVPEACFVGRYGPIESIRVSWHLTSVHTKKAVALVVGFAALLAVGVVLDTQFVDPASPVALSFQVDETTVVLRSFGLSLAGGSRFAFDVAVTALYSGVFVHQYVYGVVDESSQEA